MSSLFGNIVDWLLTQCDQLIAALITVAGWIVGEGVKVLTAFYTWFSQFFPTWVTSDLAALHSSMQGGILEQCIRVVTFTIDEFVGVQLVLTCIALVSLLWWAMVVIRVALWVKGHVWSTSS